MGVLKLNDIIIHVGIFFLPNSGRCYKPLYTNHRSKVNLEDSGVLNEDYIRFVDWGRVDNTLCLAVILWKKTQRGS